MSWSTEPGQFVSDGELGAHSPYVAGLMNAIEEELPLPSLLNAICEDVELRTRDAQKPCIEDPQGVLDVLGSAGVPGFKFF